MVTVPEASLLGGGSADDRRSNLVLRALIDEMLERVREMNRNTGVWNGDDRAKAEAEFVRDIRKVAKALAAS